MHFDMDTKAASAASSVASIDITYRKRANLGQQNPEGKRKYNILLMLQIRTPIEWDWRVYYHIIQIDGYIPTGIWSEALVKRLSFATEGTGSSERDLNFLMKRLTEKKLTVQTFSKAFSLSYWGGTLILSFDQNWLPIPDFSLP